MVRANLKKKTTLGQRLLGYALINAIPIAGLGWFGWTLARGEASLDDLPAGLGRNAAVLLVDIALLFVLVTLFLPSCHAVAKHMRATLARSAEARSKGGFLRLLWEGLLWLPRQIVYRVFWLLRFGAYVGAFSLIALALVFLVRFFRPDFLEAALSLDRWVDEGIARLREFAAS